MEGKSDQRKFTSISVPVSLFNKVKERIKETGFTSVSSYTTYILREIVAHDDSSRPPFAKEDEKKVVERLKALGYMG